MRVTLAVAALVLGTGAAFAQTSTTGTTTNGTTTTGTMTTGTMGTTATTTPPGAQTPAASVNTAPSSTSPSPSAVQTQNTTARTAVAPVPGRNSFTAGEARRRITAAGFTDVKDLKKDNQGIWRGEAMKNGAGTKVALDYQGNVVGQ